MAAGVLAASMPSSTGCRSRESRIGTAQPSSTSLAFAQQYSPHRRYDSPCLPGLWEHGLRRGREGGLIGCAGDRRGFEQRDVESWDADCHGTRAPRGVVERTFSRLQVLDGGGSGVTPPAQPVSAGPRTLADPYRDHRPRLSGLAALPARRPWSVARRGARGVRRPAPALGGLWTKPPLRWPTCAQRWSTDPARLRRRRTARDYVPPHQVNARSAESLALLAEHLGSRTRWAPRPPRQREVLVLRYYGGLSEAEDASDRHQPRHREVDGKQGAGRRAARAIRPDRQGEQFSGR